MNSEPMQYRLRRTCFFFVFKANSESNPMGDLRILLEAIGKPSTGSVAISRVFYISLTSNLNKCYVLDIKQSIFSETFYSSPL